MRKTADYIDGCFVEIYDRAVKNEKASDEQGVPVFENTVYVKIKPTNSRDYFDQPLTDIHRQRYSALFAKFLSGAPQSITGWPVGEWSQLDATQVATLTSAGILTVQALADMPETGLHRLPAGYISLKQKAQAALSQRNSGEQVRLEFEQFRAEHEKIVKELREEIEKLKEPRKPGRPKKELEDAA